MKTPLPMLLVAALAACHSAHLGTAETAVDDAAAAGRPVGWLSWRGPGQDGASPEKDLIADLDAKRLLWTYPVAGRGTPVVANGRVYALGHEGEGAALEETLFCLDEQSGQLLWEHRDGDFLTDVIYSRYALGSPTVDPETGNVFAMTGAGLLHCFTPDGQLVWEQSMAETLGRLTFPNGRTGSPLVYDDLVIIHFIFASWGPLAPARDRFFAFDKETGSVVWSSTPGGPPKDSAFSMPVLEHRDGRALFYAGLGGGFAACVDARTGDPVWRYPLCAGGVNSSMLLFGDRLIAIHGRENVDSTVIGRMVSLRLDAVPDHEGVLPKEAEAWRNDLVAFTSSPVLVGDRVYSTTQTGELACVDAHTGKVLWQEKLGPDQLHASPVAADGKLYVPLTNGSFYIIRPGEDGPAILAHETLAGSCLGAPAIANGRIYVHTTDRLYCFGKQDAPPAPAWRGLLDGVEVGEAGAPTRLQIVPADATVRAGETIDYEVRRLDAQGRRFDVLPASDVTLALPPALQQGVPGVGVVKATSGDLAGTARVRVVPTLPFAEDFDGYELDKPGHDGPGGDQPFAMPPGYWLGAGLKWQIVDRDGEKVIARRIDNPLFQRTISHFGHPDDSNYTVQIDLLTEGNRRTMCSVGVVNQRYLIVLKGNYQEIEVSSNVERLKITTPFECKVDTWYTMKARVDVVGDGTGVVRAKVWPRGESEPEAWTIEAPVPNVHEHGAAGLYGFTPQSRFTAYVDNITVTPNE